jgi:Na+/melibiose symporter-like transporter
VTKGYQVRLPTKIVYGLGSVSDGVKNTTFNVFLLFFYTQVAGLSGSLAGAAILIALVFDAVSDPLIGNISDNFHSRWGRRHPFMYAAALPMAVFFGLIFSPPQGLGQAGLFAWMLTMAIGVRVSMTLYAIPSGALVAEMTSHYDERTSLVSFRVLSGWLGGLVASQMGYLVFFAPSAAYADGRLDPQAYGDYAVFGAITIFCAILICAIGTHRLIPELKSPPAHTPFTLRRFGVELREVFSNRPYLVLVFTVLVVSTATGFTDVMGLYVNTYFWEFTTAQLAIIVFGALAGVVAAFSVTATLAQRTDKRTMALAMLLVVVIIAPLPVVLRLLGLMPANGDPLLLGIMIAWTGVIVFVAVGVTILAGSMIADTVDLNELRTGKRQEGMFSAAMGLTAKATAGIGGFVGGVVLDVVDFPTGVAAGEVDADTLFALGVAVGPGMFLLWITVLIILSRYRLSRADHADILGKLEARRNAAEQPGGEAAGG